MGVSTVVRCSFLLFFCLLAACAASPEKRTAPAQPVATEAAAPATEPTPKMMLDSDGDQVADVEDPCPLEAGDEGSDGCPSRYGYFFLRVLNAESAPVAASLAFQPVINRIVVQDDGYAGMLRPGIYHVRVEAEGYAATEMMFEVQADQKALIELKLDPQ